ncbi:RACGAP1 [Branchiostoma lanceolatum]|uniref:RACGAP1 protein n=1 Tax=Branchiostoma lanceolatum TaxID=7740 RepID=A0A8J9VPY9_BRALA|nr:RACGAP1 [Branchiostoma lanceolatum]
MAASDRSSTLTLYVIFGSGRLLSKMSLVAAFDDLVRCTNVLTEGCESEFLQFVRSQEQCRQRWLSAEMESGGMRERLVKLQAEKDALETKLKHARNQVDIEMKRRMKAEGEKDTLAY